MKTKNLRPLMPCEYFLLIRRQRQACLLAIEHSRCGIIVRQLVVCRKILHSHDVSLSYNNRKIFCKLDIYRKSTKTLALS